VGQQWSTPKSKDTSYRIEITGDPSYALEFQGHNTIFCSTPIMNCIPALVAAKPGILHPLDLPPYWSRNITPKLGPWP
jgi:4-hydroxy-tetrahydrodipicolinate reductase